MSELHEAAAAGNYLQIMGLLNSGKFEVNQKDMEWHDRTPLHWAAIKGHVQSITMLVDYGGYVDAVTDGGWTPSHFAAQLGHLDALTRLHRLEGDFEIRDNSGDTARDVAKVYGQTLCVKFFDEKQRELEAKREKARRLDILRKVSRQQIRDQRMAEAKRREAERLKDDEEEGADWHVTDEADAEWKLKAEERRKREDSRRAKIEEIRARDAERRAKEEERKAKIGEGRAKESEFEIDAKKGKPSFVLAASKFKKLGKVSEGVAVSEKDETEEKDEAGSARGTPKKEKMTEEKDEAGSKRGTPKKEKMSLFGAATKLRKMARGAKPD